MVFRRRERDLGFEAPPDTAAPPRSSAGTCQGHWGCGDGGDQHLPTGTEGATRPAGDANDPELGARFLERERLWALLLTSPGPLGFRFLPSPALRT